MGALRGPILGLVLSGAMLDGPNASTSLLLFSFGLGSATGLALAVFLGRGVLQRLRPSLRLVGWLRRGTGVAALLAVVGIASGLGPQLAGVGSSALASGLEARVLDDLPKLLEPLVGDARADERLPDLGPAPSLGAPASG